jgi:uroporphyrinogen III methyltransferase/synthase
VVVTRPAEKANTLTNLLQDRGATVLEAPTIVIADPDSWAALDEALERLRAGDYDWVVFTSVNAVEKVMPRLDRREEIEAKIAAVGSVTAGALRRHGVDVDLVPEEFTGDALARALGPGSGRVLLPRVEGAPHATVRSLEQEGWTVDEVVAYRNIVPDPPSEDSLGEADFDVVIFASGSAARNFAILYPHSAVEKVVACIGPRTAEEAERAGLQVDVIAPTHTDEGLVSALEEWYSKHPRV